jgi:hypothetical protein
MCNVKAATIDEHGMQVERAIDAGERLALFQAGMTICADVSGHPKVAPFLLRFRRAFALPGGPAFAKLYASNDGGGFAVHTDTFHVFVLQVSGTKHWRFSRLPFMQSPVQGARVGLHGQAETEDGSPIDRPDLDGFDGALLEDGHCLYLPPGTWHVARAIGSSIAVSVSPPRTPAFELFVTALKDLLLERPEWRDDLLATPGDPAPPGEIPRSASRALDGRMAELRTVLAELDPRSLHRLWRVNVAVGHAAGQPATTAQPPALRSADILARTGPERFHFLVAPLEGEDQIFFYHADAEWTFPVTARAFLTELSTHDEFTVESAAGWDPGLSFEDVTDLLGQLVAIGVLVRIGP